MELNRQLRFKSLDFDRQLDITRLGRLQRLGDLNLSKQLRKLLGNSTRFRFNQLDILQAIMDRKSPILVISPTGSGKSLLYQLPASIDLLEVTIVVLPLNSLIQDQFAIAQALNIAAAIFNANHPPDSAQLVFTTPETSLTTNFQNFLLRLQQFKRLDRIIIDEYHVALNKSQTFRRNLQRLDNLIDSKKTQVILLTATLPSKYKKSLFNTLYLSIEKATINRLSSNRLNIRYIVYQNQSSENVINIIREKHNRYSTDRLLVYTRTIADADSLTKTLKWPVYHFKSIGKDKILRKFLNSSKMSQRLIDTSSLKNDINTPNIRTVIHIDRPYNISEYSQGTKRAGRDGLESKAILLLPPVFLAQYPNPKTRNDRFKDSVITQYTQGNYRRFILSSYLDVEARRCTSSDILYDYYSSHKQGTLYSLLFLDISNVIYIDIDIVDNNMIISDDESEKFNEDENDDMEIPIDTQG